MAKCSPRRGECGEMPVYSPGNAGRSFISGRESRPSRTQPLGRQADMINTVENLILDLIEWVELRERTYQETMDAWRTSCPRLTVWEDATDRGLVRRATLQGRGVVVIVTPKGQQFLREHNRHQTRRE